MSRKGGEGRDGGATVDGDDTVVTAGITKSFIVRTLNYMSTIAA